MMSKGKGKGVHAGADGPPVVFGETNLDYAAKRAANNAGSTRGDVSSARSDFSVENHSDYPELEYESASYDVYPDMDYLLEDPSYIESLGLEEGEEPYIDYDSAYVQDMTESDREYMMEDIKNLAQEWVDNENMDDDSIVFIEGTNMGWQGLSGSRFMTKDEFLKNPIGSIQPRTNEISQNWNNDKGKLTATQSHHDAMGEKYTFTLMSREDAEENGYEPYY